MTSLPATACPACGETATSSPLCRNCLYAFAMSRAAHPASAAGDPDFWDAWALLGDAGNHRHTAAAAVMAVERRRCHELGRSIVIDAT